MITRYAVTTDINGSYIGCSQSDSTQLLATVQLSFPAAQIITWQEDDVAIVAAKLAQQKLDLYNKISSRQRELFYKYSDPWVAKYNRKENKKKLKGDNNDTDTVTYQKVLDWADAVESSDTGVTVDSDLSAMQVVLSNLNALETSFPNLP